MKRIRKMMLLAGLVVAQCFGSMQVFANEKADMTDLKEREEYDEADSWRYSPYGTNTLADSGTSVSSKAWKKINGVIYNSLGQPITNAKRVGVDVSFWNGKIDWEAAKKDGVEFAIIRCGWGGDSTAQDDSRFSYNVSECTRLGIPFGIYLYSYAYDVAGAVDEANHVIRLLKGISPALPVYYDLEENDVRASVSKENIGKIAQTFCDKVSAAGYKTGVYSNLDWFTNYLTSPVFDKYDRWCAQWNSQCDYKGNYSVWQCSSQGHIDGIPTNVDMNIDINLTDYLNGWKLEENAWYYYVNNEKKTGWLLYKNAWYYLDVAMVTSDIRSINGNVYYFDKNGKMVTNKWASVNGRWYYISSDGKAVSGWKYINSKWYYFDKDGIMQTGKITDSSNQTYYLDSNGAMVKGWKKLDNQWYYFNSDMKTGWQSINGKWYYFNSEGVMQTGKITDSSDQTYYLDSDGAMSKGWKLVDNEWYYFNSNMKTDWQKINNKWYYFDKDGIMQTGKITDSSEQTYYLDSNGAMCKGWKFIENEWYYFNSNMKTGWQFINNIQYYFTEEGKMACNCIIVIDEQSYSFDENGYSSIVE